MTEAAIKQESAAACVPSRGQAPSLPLLLVNIGKFLKRISFLVANDTGARGLAKLFRRAEGVSPRAYRAARRTDHG